MRTTSCPGSLVVTSRRRPAGPSVARTAARSRARVVMSTCPRSALAREPMTGAGRDPGFVK